MESRHTNKQASMEAEEDRLGGLPDDLLHTILRGLPLKQAARTSALSRRWARRWLRALASSPAIDFTTDRDFALRQPPARAAATVSRCLSLHASHGAPLHAFRVALSFDADAIAGDVVGWVAAAVARGAMDVEVDLLTPQKKKQGQGDVHASSALFLELPGDVFMAKNSLERLALGGFSLRAVSPSAAGLAGLRSLSLSHADVTDEAVEAMVSSCVALEFLSLKGCNHLTSVRIAGEKLRVMELVGCLAVRKLQVAAPALESFAFHGELVCFSEDDEAADAIDFGATPALRDAYLFHLGFGDYDDYRHDFAYPDFLECFEHATILTLCSVGLMHEQSALVHRIRRRTELRATAALCVIAAVTATQRRLGFESLGVPCPPELEEGFGKGGGPAVEADCLVALLGGPADASGAAAASPAASSDDEPDIVPNVDIVLDHLTFIKVVNIRGTMCELRLLRFLMNRAPSLEQLVLVTMEEEGALGSEEMKAIETRVSAMRTASPQARITVCRAGEDGSRNSAHTKYYHEY
ncbi:hypothetical protein HU200_057019 [Digitaria exilis]|uniref:F-box domain-containing protein n=1 Tax=Digitaria exilis TaxID=1010633 RepID=A0A835AC29_9POAL|nr:hypothetical protein HU200_057019 [Digitaria exilis]